MRVYVPPELRAYEEDLRFVFESMVRKLYINRHKGFVENVGFIDMLKAIEGEVDELSAALTEESQSAFLGEAIDVANMGVLAAVVALRRTKEEFMQDKVKYSE